MHIFRGHIHTLSQSSCAGRLRARADALLYTRRYIESAPFFLTALESVRLSSARHTCGAQYATVAAVVAAVPSGNRWSYKNKRRDRGRGLRERAVPCLTWPGLTMVNELTLEASKGEGEDRVTE